MLALQALCKAGYACNGRKSLAEAIAWTMGYLIGEPVGCSRLLLSRDGKLDKSGP